jgi:hypothetical protein
MSDARYPAFADTVPTEPAALADPRERALDDTERAHSIEAARAREMLAGVFGALAIVLVVLAAASVLASIWRS